MMDVAILPCTLQIVSRWTCRMGICADLALTSDLHCYKTLDACNADTDGSHGNGNGRALPHNTCSEAPPDCQYLRAVAG